LVRLVWITLFHSAISSACGGLRILMPALLTRMSIRPSSPVTRLTMAATASLSVTSAATAIALAPPCLSSATAAADLASLRPTTAIAAPARARPRAMPSPMPPLPPVTMATLPERSNGFAAMCVSFLVMPGLVPGIHVFLVADVLRTWMAGTSPAMTSEKRTGYANLAVALPDQDQADGAEHGAISGPLQLINH